MNFMEGKAGGVNIEAGSSIQCSIIEDIKINFTDEHSAQIDITINNLEESMTIDFNAPGFIDSLDEKLKTLSIAGLDIQAIFNLFQVKLVDFLLVEAMKYGMQAINSVNAEEIYAKHASSNDALNNAINDLNGIANKVMKEIEAKVQRITDINGQFPIEVFERGPLVEKAKDELLDNLHRKYILVVNQLIEKSKGNEINEPHLAAQIKDIIDKL